MEQETFEEQEITVADINANVPQEVQNYLRSFNKAIQEKSLKEIEEHYEYKWRRTTDQYFKDSRWPEPVYIQAMFEQEGQEDSYFVSLYPELYYRDVYYRSSNTNIEITVEDRHASYDHYIELINMFVEPDAPLDLELPNKWLWDMIDEFLYQFQDFVIFRSRVDDAKTESDYQEIAERPNAWNVTIVLNALHSLILKSEINEQLEAYRSGQNPTEMAGAFGKSSLYKMLGCFSLVGLVRLQCHLGDYRQALQIMKNVDLDRRFIFSLVPACNVSLHYHLGFCYLMLRRYQDAFRLFESILIQMASHRGPGHYDGGRKRDTIVCLLALAYSLLPQRLERSVEHLMNEKEGENIRKIQSGEGADEAINHLLLRGAPRFLCPFLADPQQPPEEDVLKAESERQLELFKQEAKQLILLGQIRSYLKLYTRMKLEKLAKFLELTVPQLRSMLHSFKHKMSQIVHTPGGEPLAGERQFTDSVDFYVDGDEICIATMTVKKSYGDDFLTASLKMVTSNR